MDLWMGLVGRRWYVTLLFLQSLVNRSRLLDAFVKLNIGVYAIFSGVPDDIC